MEGLDRWMHSDSSYLSLFLFVWMFVAVLSVPVSLFPCLPFDFFFLTSSFQHHAVDHTKTTTQLTKKVKDLINAITDARKYVVLHSVSLHVCCLLMLLLLLLLLVAIAISATISITTARTTVLLLAPLASLVLRISVAKMQTLPFIYTSLPARPLCPLNSQSRDPDSDPLDGNW